MFGFRKSCGCGNVCDECGCGGHKSGSPVSPMRLNNGNLTAAPNRHAPETDLDSTPRLWPHPIDASGYKHVQLNNGLQRRIGSGLRGPLNYVTYLYAATPIIPGQTRDNYGGFHKKGIDPQSYAQLWADGPGSQPVNPGGPGKIAAAYFVNPGTC